MFGTVNMPDRTRSQVLELSQAEPAQSPWFSRLIGRNAECGRDDAASALLRELESAAGPCDCLLVTGNPDSGALEAVATRNANGTVAWSPWLDNVETAGIRDAVTRSRSGDPSAENAWGQGGDGRFVRAWPLRSLDRTWGYGVIIGGAICPAARKDAEALIAARCAEAAALFAYMVAREQAEEAQDKLNAIEAELVEMRVSLDLAEEVSGTSGFRWSPAERKDIWSRATYLLLGYDPDVDQATYENVLARLHPDDLDRWKRTVEPRAAAGLDWRIEYRVLLPDGSVRVAVSMGRSEPNGWYSGGAIDLTARRKAEESLRRTQLELSRVSQATSLGELAAAIAHEVNQPLTAIGANAGAGTRWLRQGPDRLDRVKDCLREIVVDSRRAGEIIQGLHALADNAIPTFEPVQLTDLVEDVVSVLRPNMQQNGITVVLERGPACAGILGARTQIKQVMVNLINNAMEAMIECEGNPRILTIGSRPTDDDRVEVSVTDTGPGFDIAVRDQLFEAFYSTKASGMGMGLSICRSILERHGGRLFAMPRPQGGSVFGFTLPAAATPGHSG